MGIVGEHTMTTTAAIARSARIGEAYKSALARAAAHLSRQYGRAVAPAADAGESYEDAPGEGRGSAARLVSHAGSKAEGLRTLYNIAVQDGGEMDVESSKK